MTQIKSKDAKSYLSSTAMHPNSPLAQDQYLVWREKSILEVILIAEKEAEDRHAKELQELKDKAIRTFENYLKDYRGFTPTQKQYNEILGCFINELNK